MNRKSISLGAIKYLRSILLFVGVMDAGVCQMLLAGSIIASSIGMAILVAVGG